MTNVEARWNGDGLDLELPAGLGRDELLAVFLERVPADARLTQVETRGGGVGVLFRWTNIEGEPAAG